MNFKDRLDIATIGFFGDDNEKLKRRFIVFAGSVIVYNKSVENKMHKAFPLPVIEFPLAEEVPTASKESSHCQKKRDATAEKIALLLKSSSNCQSKTYESYSNGSQIKFKDINQIDEDDMEEMDIKWNMALQSMRADRNMIYHYKLGLAQVEARLAEHRSQELKYCEKIRVLEFNTEFRANCIENLIKDLELLEGKRPSPAIESTSDDAQNRNPSVTKTEESPSTVSPKPFIKFVKANDSPTKSKIDKVETAKKHHVKYAEQYRKPTKKPNGSSQNNIDDKGYWDSGYSRHMTGNISYLSDYEPFDGGYVSFGQEGYKITGKGTIKTGNFKAKGDEGYFIGYSMSSKAFRVFNRRTKRVEENLHVEFLDNKAIEKGAGPNWLFDIDSLTKSINYVPVDAGINSTNLSGTKDAASQEVKKDLSSLRYIALPNWVHDALLESSSSKPQDDCSTDVPESSGNTNPTATSTNPSTDQIETLIVETPIPTVSSLVPTACFTESQEPSSDTRLISKSVANQVETPSLDNILTLTNRFEDILEVTTNSDESNGVEADTLVDCPKGVRPIRTKWVLKNKKDERGIIIRNKARLVAQGHTQEEGINYDEVFAPIARIEAIRLFLAYASFMGFTVYQIDVKSAFLYGTIDEEVYVMQPPGFQDPEFPARVYKVEKAMGIIDQTLFIKRQRGNFILVQVYVDDIIFGSSNPQLCKEFKSLMHEKFQMSAMGELNFFLALQVLQKKDGIFLSQDKHQVTPKECHLHAVKRIFRYLKGHPKLGLWYPKESPFDLVAYSDSDYGGATQDRKSTTGGCQFLGRRLISWQCKKQTIVATSTTKAEYVADASCCGQFCGFRINCLIMDEPASPLRDVIQGEACLTVSSLDVKQDRANIAKTSTLPHESTSRVSSLAVDEGTQELKIIMLKARVKLLKDKEGGVTERSRDDAPIKGRSGVAEVPTGSGFIPTTGLPAAEIPTGSDVVPTATPIFATATVSQQRKPLTKKQQREFYTSVLRNQAEWKAKDFKGMTLEEIKENIDPVWKQIHDFIPISSKEEAERFKRKEIRFEQKSMKKLKTSEEVPEEVKSSEEVPKEKLKEMMQLVPVEEVYVEALQVKHPIIDWKGECSGTLTEPHPTPSLEAQQTSPTIYSSPSLPPVTTVNIPLVIPTVPLPTAVPTDSPNLGIILKELGLLSPQLFHLLQRQQSELMSKFEAQELEISRLKAKVKLLKDREGGATVLSSGVAKVPTGSGSIPTAGPLAAGVPTASDVVPTAGLIFTTATVMARQLEEEIEREAQRMNAQIARDAEIARIHAEEELQMMINRLDRSNETVAKYLQEYEQIPEDLSIGERIDLISDLQKKDYYMAVIKGHAGWKIKDFKGMSFKKIEAKFNTVWKQIEDFIPMGSKEEAERLKRKGLRLEQESAKKLKTSEEVPEEVKSSEEVPEEKVKEMMLLVPIEENIMHAPVEWKMYDSCGVHHVTFNDKEIFMLVEKDYPLRKGLAIVMISYKLQVENYSQMASDLILKICKIANRPRQEDD
nr:putative ribonuclease H-like domain-containing protein [Tanacetum cinerariifolium]